MQTAIKTNRSRVMTYIRSLRNYDKPGTAKLCIDGKLYEEAFTIYKILGQNTIAIQVC